MSAKTSKILHTEDWLAVWIGFIIIAVGLVAVLTGAFENAISQIKSLTEHNSRIQKERFAIEYQALQEQAKAPFLTCSLRQKIPLLMPRRVPRPIPR